MKIQEDPAPTAAPAGQFTGTMGLGSVHPQDRPRFLVASMYTVSHRAFAERLAASLSQWKLPFALYSVPAVHRSISAQGTSDTRFTKASFIRHLLDTYKVPILYVDCDCVVRSETKLVQGLVESGTEFAIYNWLADESTDAYVPMEMRGNDGRVLAPATRFFRFSHSIDAYSPTQLICSGATQFYANTAPVRELLATWSAVIDAHPGVPDDQCLDFAFNMRMLVGRKPRYSWLPKNYARILFWIFSQPVIDHPQFPAAASGSPAPVPPASLEPRFNAALAERRADSRGIPRDCIVDTEAKRILRLQPSAQNPAVMEALDIGPLWQAVYLQ
jgi:hypothetical protein